MIKLQVALLTFLSVIAASGEANQQADQQTIVFTNSSVFVDDLEIIQPNGGHIETDISGATVLSPNRTGWINFRLTIHEDDNSTVILPSGQSIPVSDLYSLTRNQAWFWMHCEGAGCPEGGDIGQVFFSHTRKGDEVRERHFIANQLNFSSHSHPSEESLPLSVIYISVPHLGKEGQDFLQDCDSEYICSDSTGLSDDAHDMQYKKKGAGFQAGELPLFNQIDRVAQLLSISSPGSGFDGLPVIRSQRASFDNLLPSYSKRDYMEQVIHHRDRVIQINMLFLPITSPVPEGASPITLLQPMQVIMNWLPGELRNANEIYAVHSGLFRAAGLKATSFQNFHSIFITENGELKTQKLLDFWEQNLGDMLAEKLKPVLTQMRLQQPDHVVNAFHQLVTTKDMKKVEEVVVHSRESHVHRILHNTHQASHGGGLADLVSEKTPELFGTKDGKDLGILGVAVSGPDGGMSVVKKDKESASKVKGSVAIIHTLGSSGDVAIERRGTYQKDGKEVTAFEDMAAQTREHSHKKPKDDDEPGGFSLGFGVSK
ncbi:MAG: hypothetical protein ACR2PX_10170 [Endozoicomonas sp.]|uniref:hypothetical protein n=1 Tax=Endozoicomonas sp. TaxID=1892382 RepID=UPI003D9BC4CD